ncbi:MAG: AAA family ATPase [Acidimicrobiales bacterium]|nr:AAA family ATPase [Acidimicrobiales bacterium]
MAIHPDMAAEQAYIDRAYACLEQARTSAARLKGMVEVGKGGTEQARFEREVIFDTVVHRLQDLNLGNAALLFGRIDLEQEVGAETFYIGRLAVSDENQEPVVVDWRAPVAEPFYRATGRVPMGLARRRYFSTRGRQLLGIEDELFGEHALDLGEGAGLQGHGSLIRALETARTGRMGDIVATIQGEQDEIIRAPLPGVMVVQGGPGTGKTVVALHRAAYLLYTHRFPLEDQGVLVIGPNRLFLAYIEQVLPSLGEAGVELAVLADLVEGVRVKGRDNDAVARLKGHAVMSKILAKAVRDRKRALRRPLRVGVGLQTLALSVATSEEIVRDARRRYHHHNAGRRFVEREVAFHLAESARQPLDPNELWRQIRREPSVRAALEEMWPVLTPAQLLHDLFGSKALLHLAAGRKVSEREIDLLYRQREASADNVVWTHDDVPLLDEARALLGPKPRKVKRDEDEIRTYGHIVVDEAQDLSPMQLAMIARRSLNGSLTVVGDIAQSTGAWAHADWNEILSLLPSRREPRREELTVGYRIPGPNMDLAARVLAVSAPELTPPRSVRQDGRKPVVVRVDWESDLASALVNAVLDEVAAVESGNVAVICPASRLSDCSEALSAAGIDHGVAIEQGLNHQVTVVPVGIVKGLELDATVVVDPAAIIAEEAQGMRALYVALTRATKLLTIVYVGDLPEVLASDDPDDQPVGAFSV